MSATTANHPKNRHQWIGFILERDRFGWWRSELPAEGMLALYRLLYRLLHGLNSLSRLNDRLGLIDRHGRSHLGGLDGATG